MRVTHPASFFTALPLSTAGRVINIHEGAEGCGPEARWWGGLQEYLLGVRVDHCIVHGSFNELSQVGSLQIWSK